MEGGKVAVSMSVWVDYVDASSVRVGQLRYGILNFSRDMVLWAGCNKFLSGELKLIGTYSTALSMNMHEMAKESGIRPLSL